MIPALFVTHRHSLHGLVGGQQTCTQEYWKVLTAAGFSLRELCYETPNDLWTKIRRKIRPHPYQYEYPKKLAEKIGKETTKSTPKIIFLNLNDTIPLARELVHLRIPLVLLSHGFASVDQFHENRIQGYEWRNSNGWKLIQQLEAEGQGIPYFNHVFCLSETEVAISRWMGAASTGWLPRLIEPEFLEVKPEGSRLGCIGTMDHPPNREGMELFLKNLKTIQSWHGRIRLISRSELVCKRWACDYEFVDYLGPLGEEAVRAEASTWSAFLHPIFCHAMGCSTKLATGIRWGLPIVTSEAGARGYQIANDLLPYQNLPVEMAEYAVTLLDPNIFRESLKKTHLIAQNSPSLQHVAEIAKEQLRHLNSKKNKMSLR